MPELTKRECENAPEVFRCMDSALSNRTVSATKMNASSSRSHMVMMIKCTQKVNEVGQKIVSTMNFADLAGSEKMKKTEAKGKRAEEAKKINLSLTQLGIVISELAKGKKHVSYLRLRINAGPARLACGKLQDNPRGQPLQIPLQPGRDNQHSRVRKAV